MLHIVCEIEIKLLLSHLVFEAFIKTYDLENHSDCHRVNNNNNKKKNEKIKLLFISAFSNFQ